MPVKRQRLDVNFVRLHRTARRPAEAIAAGPLRLAPVPRAVADTAWHLTGVEDVRAIVTEALAASLCTAAELTRESLSPRRTGSMSHRPGCRRPGNPDPVQHLRHT